MKLLSLSAVAVILSAPLMADEVGDTVVLQFNWQAGIHSSAKVVAERVSVKNDQETIQSTMTANVISRLEAHPDGFSVFQTTDNVNIQADMGEMTQYIKPLMESVSTVDTQYIVSNTGELLDIEGLEPVIESLRETIGLMVDDSPAEIKPVLNNMATQMVNKEHMVSKAFDSWNAQVQQWIGAEFEKGYYYAVEYSEPVVAFGGLELDFTGAYEYQGKAECNETGKEQGCVVLLFTSSLLPASAAQLTDIVIQQMNLPIPDGLEMSLDTSILLITEAETLKPHYYEKIQTTTFPNKNEAETEQRINRSSYTYTYH